MKTNGTDLVLIRSNKKPCICKSKKKGYKEVSFTVNAKDIHWLKR